jgi:arylsulfatase A-like enzyme
LLTAAYDADDMGWAAMGYHNPGNVFTPNFDEEAAAGIILDRHYSFRWCAPTRSALVSFGLPALQRHI